MNDVIPSGCSVYIVVSAGLVVVLSIFVRSP